jgi:hypothetical protein
MIRPTAGSNDVRAGVRDRPCCSRRGVRLRGCRTCPISALNTSLAPHHEGEGRWSAARRIHQRPSCDGSGVCDARTPCGAPSRRLRGGSEATARLRPALAYLAPGGARPLQRAPRTPPVVAVAHSSLHLRKLRTLVCAAPEQPECGFAKPARRRRTRSASRTPHEPSPRDRAVIGI